LELAGLQLREIILTKTEKGKNLWNNPFPAYSKSYSEAKGKTTVDLYDKGNMLPNFTSKVLSNKQVQLFFRNKKEADKAKWHHYGMGKLPKRPFFGYSKKTEKVIRNEFEKFMKRHIKL
jgi:phage gpG-like protein